MQHTDIITLNIRDLIPHPRNPRKISQEAIKRKLQARQFK